jgi:hypothetical protein
MPERGEIELTLTAMQCKPHEKCLYGNCVPKCAPGTCGPDCKTCGYGQECKDNKCVCKKDTCGEKCLTVCVIKAARTIYD